jgi:hypothetical protein
VIRLPPVSTQISQCDVAALSKIAMTPDKCQPNLQVRPSSSIWIWACPSAAFVLLLPALTPSSPSSPTLSSLFALSRTLCSRPVGLRISCGTANFKRRTHALRRAHKQTTRAGNTLRVDFRLAHYAQPRCWVLHTGSSHAWRDSYGLVCFLRRW